jgi:hypothetical protein
VPSLFPHEDLQYLTIVVPHRTPIKPVYVIMPSSNSEEEDGHPNKVDNSDIYSDNHDKDDDDLEDESDNKESDDDTHDTINGKKCNIANKDKVTVVYCFQIKDFDVFTGDKGAEYVGAIEKGPNEYMAEQKVAFTKHPANLIHDSSISAATAAALKKTFVVFINLQH